MLYPSLTGQFHFSFSSILYQQNLFIRKLAITWQPEKQNLNIKGSDPSETIP